MLFIVKTEPMATVVFLLPVVIPLLATYGIHLTALSCELVACHIQLADQSSLITCSVYRPPSSDESYLAELCRQLRAIHMKFPNSALWIAGDTNRPDIN